MHAAHHCGITWDEGVSPSSCIDSNGSRWIPLFKSRILLIRCYNVKKFAAVLKLYYAGFVLLWTELAQ